MKFQETARGDIPDVLPKHIAIVMDGNGRWAKARGRPRIAGHRAGVDSVKKVIKACMEWNIEVLSLFAFSSENWNRPRQEVEFLMNSFLTLLRKDMRKMQRNNVQVRIVGNRSRFSLKLQDSIHEVERLTETNTGLKLVIAADYGGWWDVEQATRKIAQKIQSGDLSVSQIDESVIAQHLMLSDLPHPDLFIRTSGEKRISNFFLMQLAYTELYFTPTYWPDFDKNCLLQALKEFATRERRYGAIGNTSPEMDIKSA